MPVLRKIVSGGQTGADRAGLDFAIETGLEHGGFVPKGRKAEDGRIDDKYNLVELSTDLYPARTKRNIEESGRHRNFQPRPVTEWRDQVDSRLCYRAWEAAAAHL